MGYQPNTILANRARDSSVGGLHLSDFSPARRVLLTALLSLGAAGLPAASHAAVQVGGGGSALEVKASGDAISDVLVAISKVVTVRYRTSVQLGTTISGTYRGSVDTVIAHLLRDYSFAIRHNGKSIEVSIFGRWTGQPNQNLPTPSPLMTSTFERHSDPPSNGLLLRQALRAH